jgi:hypothetical protein
VTSVGSTETGTAANCDGYHTVVSGDSCAAIEDDTAGAEYCGQGYYGTFDCGITWLGACVGPEVSVAVRDIDVDYNTRRSVG